MAVLYEKSTFGILECIRYYSSKLNLNRTFSLIWYQWKCSRTIRTASLTKSGDVAAVFVVVVFTI